jgi:hypothetical protein
MEVSSQNIQKYKSKKSFRTKRISYRSRRSSRSSRSRRSSLSKKSKKVLKDNDSDLIVLPKISKRTSVLDDKTIGIISLNAEGAIFPKKIDELSISTFQGFQKLDIIIVGLQEDKKSSGSIKFMETLLPNHVLIADEYMGGVGKVGLRGTRMLIFLYFTQTSLKSNIKTIQLCDNSSCLLGLPCCNKGLDAINFFDEFVIINSHLVLGVHKLLFKEAVNTRVCMMESLFKRLKKEFKWDDIQNKKIIWFGDLNFRVSPNQEKDENIIDIINEIMETGGTKVSKLPFKLKLPLNDSFNIEKYIQNDELKKLLEGKYKNANLRCIFPMDLYEGNITFKPSCKLDKGSETIYNVINEGKIRLPSWCDRILFNYNIQQNYDVEYNSYKFPIKSDHKGVYAIFKPKKSDIQE